MDDLYWTILLKWMMIWGYPLICSVSYANVPTARVGLSLLSPFYMDRIPTLHCQV